jgi:hypothetical protein
VYRYTTSNRSKCGAGTEGSKCKFGEGNPSVAKPFVINKDTIRIGSIDKQSGGYTRWAGAFNRPLYKQPFLYHLLPHELFYLLLPLYEQFYLLLPLKQPQKCLS